MNDLPECPMAPNCRFGTKHNYGKRPRASAWPECSRRRRTEDGLFECSGFREKPLVTLDKLPDPEEELFPEHDYGRK